tara:strand:- start:659 stop:1243 length:585 start_codon:yes stop_codon:yes gene_type:complete
MVIVESMAAFALVKGAVDAVKSAMDTADDVKGIYNGLDALFKHKDAVDREVGKKKKETKPRSKLAQFFGKKMGDDTDDDLGVGAVAAMVLEQKKIDRDILNLGIRIDNKFGEGTWDEILATRETLLQERKEKRKKAKEAAAAHAKEDQEFYDKIIHWIIEFGKFIAIAVLVSIVAYTVWINRAGAIENNLTYFV